MSKITKQTVIPVVLRLECDCGGQMNKGNTVLTTYPAKYSYTCELCGYNEISIESYPMIKYEEEGEV